MSEIKASAGRRKPFQELTFTDDFMFCKVLENNPELCRRLLELILCIEIGRVEISGKQFEIGPNSDKKTVRLDIYLNDEANTHYDLEMQTSNSRELPKRSLRT